MNWSVAPAEFLHSLRRRRNAREITEDARAEMAWRESAAGPRARQDRPVLNVWPYDASRREESMAARKHDDGDLLKARGGRIDPLRVPEGTFDADSRIDQAIAESFPASDPPSWNSGLDDDEKPESQ